MNPGSLLEQMLELIPEIRQRLMIGTLTPTDSLIQKLDKLRVDLFTELARQKLDA